MKKNYLTFIFNYIVEHKKELAEVLPKKKDVTTNTLKNMISDEGDVTIMASITECVDIILKDETISVEDFMRLSRGNDADLENDFINDKYDDFNINGDFVDKYKELIDPITRTEIETQVRIKMLQKYSSEDSGDSEVSKILNE